MPAVLHLLSADGIAGPAVVDDVIALDGSHDGAVAHVIIAGAGALDVMARERLGRRLSSIPGPGSGPALRDITLLDDVGRALRELIARHGETALHAHGVHARSLGSLVGAAAGVAVVVDAGDERPAHRLLPPPSRTVFSSHGDLDRALEAGHPARFAAIVPPGVERAQAANAVDDDGDNPAHTPLVVVDASAASPGLVAALSRAGLRVSSALTTTQALGAALIVVGATAHLGHAVCSAVAAGVPCFALSVPWAEELKACAAFVARDRLEVDEVLELARRGRRRPRKLPRDLGPAARVEALDEVYGGLIGPRVRRHPPRRPSR